MTDASARPRGAKNPATAPVAARPGRRLRRCLPALLGLLALLSGPSAALATSGGVGSPGPEAASPDPAFGTRVLRPGMQGEDVRVLNGIVASKSYAENVRLSDVFETPTAAAVREFQSRKGLSPSGVVDPGTAGQLTSSMRQAEASWYGPGLYGNSTACGQTLRPSTLGVAHKSLPCGTKVTFAHHGHYVVARVIDRGPFVAGRTWDLTSATSEALGLTSVANVRYAVDR